MTYRILPAALDDLAEIDAYVTEKFGSAAAQKAQVRLFNAFDNLANFQQLGRLQLDVTSRPVRFIFSNPYWIVYREGSPLLIHRVVHGSRDLLHLSF